MGSQEQRDRQVAVVQRHLKRSEHDE